MRRRDRLTRRERRQFDGLVKVFFEREAPDPQAAPPAEARTPDPLRPIDPRHPSTGPEPQP
jgi:hypothetical protein